MLMKYFLPLALIAALFAGCQSQPRNPSPQTQHDNRAASRAKVQTAPSGSGYALPDDLASMNKLFLDGYRRRQTFLRTNISPLLVAYFNTVALYRNGVSETNAVIPDTCNSLKVVAHIPFGIYLRVAPYTQGTPWQIPNDILSELKEYQERIVAVTASLTTAGFSESQLPRQREILDRCKSYLDQVVATGRSSSADLSAFTHGLGPLMLVNANEAARAQIDATHAVVMRWKAKVPADEWRRLVVIVPGLQMPRRLNICTQYFAKLLGELPHNLGYPLESRRLIYAEFIFSSRDYFDLMATTFIDGDASEAFFGDRWRMSRDVLADGAEEYLKTLKFD